MKTLANKMKAKMVENKGFDLTFMLGNVQVWPHFDKRDLWIGVYWSVEESGDPNETIREYSVYACIVPCFPIRFVWFR